MTLKIKICGITRAEDAEAAVEAGADALGFMFFEGSSRYISPEKAKEIIRGLPPFVSKVGVFVNAGREVVERTIAETGIDTLQFHGEETPGDCEGFGLKTVKAFRVAGEESLGLLPPFKVDAWLLDSFVKGERGGTGVTFNWDLAERARALGTPVILAGGLTPENIEQAVRQVRPFGVDVSSGVESAPGKKDARMIAEFIKRARHGQNS